MKKEKFTTGSAVVQATVAMVLPPLELNATVQVKPGITVRRELIWHRGGPDNPAWDGDDPVWDVAVYDSNNRLLRRDINRDPQDAILDVAPWLLPPEADL